MLVTVTAAAKCLKTSFRIARFDRQLVFLLPVFHHKDSRSVNLLQSVFLQIICLQTQSLTAFGLNFCKMMLACLRLVVLSDVPPS